MLLYVYLIVSSNSYAQLIQCKNVGSVLNGLILSHLKGKNGKTIHHFQYTKKHLELLTTLRDVTYHAQANR